MDVFTSGNIDAVLATCPHNLDGRTIDPKACNPRSAQKPKKTATQHCPKVLKYYHLSDGTYSS